MSAFLLFFRVPFHLGHDPSQNLDITWGEIGTTQKSPDGAHDMARISGIQKANIQ
jgi:hypothetical protein